MKDIMSKRLIICSKERRGSGNSEHSPIRVITEVFDLKGELIADKDPYYATPEAIVDFLVYKFDIPRNLAVQNTFEYFVKQSEI